jgi:3-dehydroquinate dehydratase-2
LDTRKILILNGPNLNLLGKREPEHYGSTSLAILEAQLRTEFSDLDLVFFQSNHEGELIDKLQDAEKDGFTGVVFNAAAYTHTSIAIADAVAAIDIPVVEVHISNTYRREAYRQKSLMAAHCKGVIIGFGLQGYSLGINSLID